jgi:protein-glutamine gamma-glutamyltransferase
LGIRLDVPWIKHLRYTLDAAANGWNQWILGYTQERQAQLLSKMGMERVNWQKLTLLLLVFAAAATGILALSLLRDIHFRRSPAAPRIYRRFLKKVARLGLRPRNGEGPLDFAQRVISANGTWTIPVQTITEHYVAIRYGRENNEHRLRALAQAVRQFSP